MTRADLTSRIVKELSASLIAGEHPVHAALMPAKCDLVWGVVSGALRERLIKEAKERETNNEQGRKV